MIAMKTSKKILIGFLSVVGLFCLSLLLQFGPKNDFAFERAAIELPQFNHLVLLNTSSVALQQGRADSAIVRFDIKAEPSFPDYEMRGDTLVLSWPNTDHNWYRVINFSNLKSITTINSTLNVHQIASDSIWIFAEASRIVMQTRGDIDFMSLELNEKSSANIKGTNVKSVDAEVNSSEAQLNIRRLGKLRAGLKNSSTLSTMKVLHSNVQSDESSRYYSR